MPTDEEAVFYKMLSARRCHAALSRVVEHKLWMGTDHGGLRCCFYAYLISTSLGPNLLKSQIPFRDDDLYLPGIWYKGYMDPFFTSLSYIKAWRKRVRVTVNPGKRWWSQIKVTSPGLWLPQHLPHLQGWPLDHPLPLQGHTRTLQRVCNSGMPP